MKYIYCLLLFCTCVSLKLSAQEELKPLASIAAFQERLKQEAANIRCIESDFTQEKYLDVFSEKVISKGRFYFKQDNMIRMDYSSPLNYLIIINGQKLKTVSEGKSNVVNLGSNPMMNEMKGMLSACMIGDLNAILLQTGILRNPHALCGQNTTDQQERESLYLGNRDLPRQERHGREDPAAIRERERLHGVPFYEQEIQHADLR